MNITGDPQPRPHDLRIRTVDALHTNGVEGGGSKGHDSEKARIHRARTEGNRMNTNSTEGGEEPYTKFDGLIGSSFDSGCGWDNNVVS